MDQFSAEPLEHLILRVFTRENLQPVGFPDGHVGIPARTMDFLKRVGLPKSEYLGFTFNFASQIKRFEFNRYCPQNPRLEHEVIYFGNNDGLAEVIDCTDHECVLVLDTDSACQATFVNSWVGLLVGSIAMCVEHWTRIARSPACDRVASALIVRKWLELNDPVALASYSHFWAPVVEQLEQGLL